MASPRTSTRGIQRVTTPAAAGPPAPPQPLSDDRRKHLDYIQAVIGRMASNSGVAKGWALTVATASYGYALTRPAWPVAVVGVLAMVMFGLVDANYLRQERLFRHLFDQARLGRVDVYVMDTSGYHSVQGCGRAAVIWSWSVLWFYGPLVITGVVSGIAAYVMSR